MPITLSVVSLEYIKVPVNVKKNGVYIDPTLSPVSMAFLTTKLDVPDSGDWKTASWEQGLGYKHFIRCLVGPGATVLVAGIYWVWIKIEDAPETPVRQVGSVKIT